MPPETAVIVTELPDARTDWPGLLIGIASPLITASVFLAYRLWPGHFPEGFDDWLLVLLLTEIPLTLLSTGFAAVLSLEMSTQRRVFTYCVIVAVLAATGGMWRAATSDWLAPIFAWAIIGHVLALVFVHGERSLLVARTTAVAEDLWKLLLLVPLGSLIIGLAALAISVIFKRADGTPLFTLGERDLMWIGAGHFLMRAWSSAYAHTTRFARTRRAAFDRPWVVALITFIQRKN